MSCNRYNHHFLQFRVLLSQTRLIFEDLLGRFDSIHTRHVDVCQDDTVAHVAAGLGHVSDVHVELLPTVVSLVDFKPVGVIQYGLKRNHVKDNVVSDKDSCLATTLLLTLI